MAIREDLTTNVTTAENLVTRQETAGPPRKMEILYGNSNSYGNSSGNSGRKKHEGKCSWCQKQGRSEDRCYLNNHGKPRIDSGGSSNGNSANNTTDDVADMFARITYCQVAASATVVENRTEELWLGDSGATSHITNNSYAMKNKK